MEKLINELTHDKILIAMAIFILLDTFLGCLRAAKEKKWNSCFGINGLLRKVAMVGSVALLMVIDYIFNVNFISFIPKEIMNYLGNIEIGISSLFAILFILYETTSIFKNMVLCGLPIPAKIKSKVEEMLKEFTTELENKK